jgi:deferrochelatase/peroxidase EfeB
MVEKPGSSLAGGEPARTTEGTYQVVRLIRFAIELRDAEPVQRHEDVFGRDKRSGRR